MYYTRSIKKYIEDLGAKRPVPGGGSAAALSGALGIALLEMVCNFTLGNERYRRYERHIKRHSRNLSFIKKAFVSAIDEDARIYLLIRKAFSQNDAREKKRAIKEGYFISEKICRLSRNGMEIAHALVSRSNQNLVTDIGCGLEMLNAAFNSARYNAFINLKFMEDGFFVKKETLNLSELSREARIFYKKTSLKLKKKTEV